MCVEGLIFLHRAQLDIRILDKGQLALFRRAPAKSVSPYETTRAEARSATLKSTP